MSPEEIVSRILYRDRLMMVIDKPSGLPVHAGPKGGPNLEMFFDALRLGLPHPPALAHRLDRDTSGCLILGRQRNGLRRLGKLFAQGRIAKTYWAVVEGGPEAEEGVIDAPLAKLTPLGGWKMAVCAEGQPAVTEYRVRGRADGWAWLELRPRTGRTHQVRVHCAHLGCPVAGDPVYGRDRETLERLHLHARAVEVPLYPDKPPVVVAASPPAHMRRLLAACGWSDRD